MANLRFDNPFHDLWVTEILHPHSFVKLFSPVLVEDAEAIFSTGNIVLKGREGCGKSMLLRLLETSTRIAYLEKDTPYPIPSDKCNFIIAGVQLTHTKAAMIAQRAYEAPEGRRRPIAATNFADYLNVMLCLDLLHNIVYLNEQQENGNFLPGVEVNFSTKNISSFVRMLLDLDVWGGLVPPSTSNFAEVISALKERLSTYHLYANGNIIDLPKSIMDTRTFAGEPASLLSDTLKNSGIVSDDTLIMLRIDQNEELYEAERRYELEGVLRQVVNSILARREPNIAYRIGTRHYSWEQELRSWGSGAPIEPERDYSIIDIDEILKREEASKGWKFPILAKDVVAKRVEYANIKYAGDDPIKTMFGASLNAKDRAREYVGDVPCKVNIDKSWVPEWKEYLTTLWNDGEPLDAWFGAAWLRQKNQQRNKVPFISSTVSNLPWRRSPWWAKERNEVALMQIAGSNQQAMKWSGARQVIDLGGGNILAFMTLCKTVWATWQRRNPSAAEINNTLPLFSGDDQVIGIKEASQLWLDKIRAQQDAENRRKFITCIGEWFRKDILDDHSLSNPGHNGFSLSLTDFESDSVVVELIKVCRDRGDLLESIHTTKNKDQEQRKKWYLHPLLCPRFRIPSVRTKEPKYTTLDELKKMLESSGVMVEQKPHKCESSQIELFPR